MTARVHDASPKRDYESDTSYILRLQEHNIWVKVSLAVRATGRTGNAPNFPYAGKPMHNDYYWKNEVRGDEFAWVPSSQDDKIHSTLRGARTDWNAAIVTCNEERMWTAHVWNFDTNGFEAIPGYATAEDAKTVAETLYRLHPT